MPRFKKRDVGFFVYQVPSREVSQTRLNQCFLERYPARRLDDRRESRRLGVVEGGLSFATMDGFRSRRAPAFLEYPGEDFVDVAQLAFQVEGVLDLAGGHAPGDILVGQHELVKVQIFLPRAHGVT